MLATKCFTFNPFQVNTYIISDEEKNCIILDAGCSDEQEQNKLLNHIDENNLNPVFLLYTHGHVDHMLGNNFLKEKYDLKSYMHKSDISLVKNAQQFAAMFGMSVAPLIEPDHFIDENDSVQIGRFSFRILHVPGHSQGSLVFFQPEQKMLFPGDVLFNGSIGRTDLPGGDYNTLVNGIKEKLMVLEDDVKVFSGHGETTTIGAEKKSNPFLL